MLLLLGYIWYGYKYGWNKGVYTNQHQTLKCDVWINKIVIDLKNAMDYNPIDEEDEWKTDKDVEHCNGKWKGKKYHPFEDKLNTTYPPLFGNGTKPNTTFLRKKYRSLYFPFSNGYRWRQPLIRIGLFIFKTTTVRPYPTKTAIQFKDPMMIQVFNLKITIHGSFMGWYTDHGNHRSSDEAITEVIVLMEVKTNVFGCF